MSEEMEKMLGDVDECEHPVKHRRSTMALPNGDGSVSVLIVCANCGNGQWVEYEHGWTHGVER